MNAEPTSVPVNQGDFAAPLQTGDIVIVNGDWYEFDGESFVPIPAHIGPEGER